MDDYPKPSPESLQLRPGEPETYAMDYEKAVRQAWLMNSFMDDIARMAGERHPDLGPAVYLAGELMEITQNVELHTMTAELSTVSAAHAAHNRISSDIDQAVYDKIGDRLYDISAWLSAPEFIAVNRDSTGAVVAKTERKLGDYDYDVMYVYARRGREYLNYRNADFHGQRTHNAKYFLDLSETDEKQDDGYSRKDYRGIKITGEYSTDDQGNILPDAHYRVEIAFVHQNGGSFGQTFNGDSALFVLGWLDRRSATLLQEAKPLEAQTEFYAHNQAGQRPNYAADYAPVDTLDLEAERSIIASWRKRYESD